MEKLKKKKILKWIGIIMICLLYLFVIILFVNKDIYYDWYGIYIPGKYNYLWHIRLHYFKRIPLYFLEHLGGILYFVTCLLYIKRKKMVSYICGVITLLLLLLSIRYDLPLYPRNLGTFRMNWGTDVIEYFFPALYLGMFVFLLFFPALCDAFRGVGQGKRAMVWLAAFWVESIRLCSLIYDVICERSSVCFEYADWKLLTAAILIQAGLLFCLYKIILKKEHLQRETQKIKSGYLLKLAVPIGVIGILLFTNITITGEGVILPRRAQIDGYWYFGNVEGFIETYENPYRYKRNYLEFEYIKEETSKEEDEGYYAWEDEEGNQLIRTCGRKLEAVYYLDNFTEEERLTSDRHPVDTFWISTQYGEEGSKDFRAVLSEEVYEGTDFYYRFQSDVQDIHYAPVCWNIYIWYWELDRMQMYRKIERYDILTEGKEIPAYFLGMVEKYGVIRVEPFSHYWGENFLEKYRNVWFKLRPVRQY